MNTKSYVTVSLLQVHLCIFMQFALLDFMVICIFRLHHEFEGVFVHLSCGILINCGHVLIFISLSSFMISIKIFYLKQLIGFGAFSFLRKILFLFFSFSFHFFQTSIFHSLSPHFFSSNSTLGHYISCLIIYLSFAIFISFILHQEPYLQFNLIHFITCCFSSISF